jgi:uncharacterized protein YcnI/copper(I)-binding protein
MIRFALRAAVAAAAIVSLATPALAHATFEVPEAIPGASYKAVLRIPHGCGTEATHTVRVQIPEGFFNVKPMPKAGWTLETVTGPYENSYDNHGTAMTEGVKEIVWSGGNLPNEWYDEFAFRGTFADTLEPGAVHFPSIQECANGEEAWIDLTGEGERPAPSVELLAAGGQGEHHHAAAPAAEAAAAVGDIAISGAFTRATLPNAPVGGGFLTLANSGAQDDVLVSASAGFAAEVQLHEMAMDGDVMRMRQLTGGIAVPAGETVTLAPGGLHIMFMGLKAPLVEGETVAVTLTFETAGTVTIDLPVLGTAADEADGGGHHGH